MKSYKINWIPVSFILIILSIVITLFVQRDNNRHLNILFIGNSITKHEPKPSIGWNGNYGMAATSSDNDYVHKFIKLIKEQFVVDKYMAVNVAAWERDFFVDKKRYLSAKSFKPDLIIIRLGENVNENYARKTNFQQNLLELINYFKSDNETDVLITNTFWPREFLNKEIFELSKKQNYMFVDISDLWADKSNAAYGEYENIFIQRHPSDKGMNEIAKRIYKIYNKEQD